MTGYLARIFASKPPCPGDDIRDRVVTFEDVSDYWRTVITWAGSSTPKCVNPNDQRRRAR